MTRARHAWLAALALCMSFAASALPQSLRFDFGPSPLEQYRAASEARKRRLRVPRRATPPVIDGVLNDAAWRGTPFVRRLFSRPPVTAFRACFDDRALYVGVVCEEVPGYKARSKPHPRDGAAWKDDCLEIFILPSPRDAVHQFIINASNAIYDQRAGKPSYNPDWQHATRRDEKGWVAEFAIPFKALGLKGPAAEIGFNIGRNGPVFTPQSWMVPYHDAANSSLILRGVKARTEERAAARLKPSPFVATEGESLRLRMGQLTARPGDRWLEADLRLRLKAPLARTKVEARLYRVGDATPVETVAATPQRAEGRLAVDLRRHGLDRAQLVLTCYEDGRRTGGACVLLDRRPCERPFKPGEKVPIRLDLPKGVRAVTGWPVTFGLPFPAGAVWEPVRVRFVDQQGREVPAQTEVTGRWARRGAVKWLRVDALVSSARGCFAEMSPPAAARPGPRLTLRESGGAVTVDTGAATYLLGPGPSPIREVRRQGRRVAWSDGARGLYLIDRKGRLGRASAEGETVTVEARGPVAACVRFEGWYRSEDGKPMARHITRVQAYAGQPFARVTHTLVITEDTNKLWFKDVGWEFAVAPGAEPEALFGIAPGDVDSAPTSRVPLRRGAAGAYMFQDSHYAFGHGSNHFSIAILREDGGEAKQADGAECGDWAALRGRDHTFMAACRDAARQHPKEFEVTRDKVVLRLFSNRGGEELDWRAPTLVKKWDLGPWLKAQNLRTRHGKIPAKAIETARSYKMNAAGWAKTHELLFAALPPATDSNALARLGLLHSRPVYAAADPKWLDETGALAPNTPLDPKRYVEAETGLRKVLQWWTDRVAVWGDYGFMDYGSGPHFSYSMEKWPFWYRFVLSGYTFLSDVWLLYARSGDRDIRFFAEEANRGLMDYRHSHWGEKRGVYRYSNRMPEAGLPFLWGSGSMLEGMINQFPNDFIWYYQLTGYRRAKEVVLEYGEALKKQWSEPWVKMRWNLMDVASYAARIYELTEDPAYRVLAERTLDFIEDEESAVGLTKRTYHTSSHKNHQGIRYLTEMRLALGGPRLDRMCRIVGKRVQEFPYEPFRYTSPAPVVGPYLYDLTGDPAHVQSLIHAVRLMGGVYDPAKDALPLRKIGDRSKLTCLFNLGGVLSALERAKVTSDLANVASWIHYTDPVGSSRVIARKDTDEQDIRLHSEGGRVAMVRPIETRLEGAGSPIDASLVRVNQYNLAEIYGPPKGEVRVPKDAPPGDYEIVFDGAPGRRSLFASSRASLVLYAPDYWIPSLENDRLSPTIRVYFRLPEGTKDARIYFAEPARLYAPDGAPWPDSKPRQGWVDLPGDRAGLWAFAPVVCGVVRLANAPPFFAFNDPAAHFVPRVIRWPATPVEAPPPQGQYVPGLSGAPRDKAVKLAGDQYLYVTPPARWKKGFPATREGTVEFYLKPNWDSFGPSAKRRGLLAVPPAKFFVDVSPTLGITASLLTVAGGKRARVGRYRRGPFFVRGRWTHVAIVWGDDGVPSSSWHGPMRNRMCSKFRVWVFLDGKRGARYGLLNYEVPAEGRECLPLPYIGIGGMAKINRVDGAVDNLRISDVQRYREDFTPPPRASVPTADEHTLGLFLFDGDLEGRGHGLDKPLKAKVRN